MITECGTVTGIAPGSVRVACERQSGCRRCAEGKGCGGGLLGLWLGRRLHEVEAATPVAVPVIVGDRVRLGLAESVLLRAALLAYGLPLLGLLLGGASAAGLGLGDLGAAAGAAMGLGAGLAATGHLSRRWRQRVRPLLLERLERE